MFSNSLSAAEKKWIKATKLIIKGQIRINNLDAWRFLQVKVIHVVNEAQGRINYHLIEMEREKSKCLLEFLQKLTSNNRFQLFLDTLLSTAPEKDHLDWIVI